MQNKAFIQDGLIFNVYMGDQDYESVMDLAGRTLELAREFKVAGLPVLVITDITRIGRLGTGIRKAAKEAFEIIPFDKVSIFGGNSYMDQVVPVILRFLRRDEMVGYCRSQEEAETWLREK